MDRATAIPKLVQEEYAGVSGVEPAYIDRETLLIDQSAGWLPLKKQRFDEMKLRPEAEELDADLKRGIGASKTTDTPTPGEEKNRVGEE